MSRAKIAFFVMGMCVTGWWALAQEPSATTGPALQSAEGESPAPVPTLSDPFIDMDAPKIFSRSINVEGYGAVKYLACQPGHIKAGEMYPLILALPAGDGSEAMVRGGLELYWARPAVARGYLVVSPIARKGAPFNKEGADLVVPFLKAILNEIPADPKLVFLAGVSNGGVGALRVALDHPKLFCGLIGIPMSYRESKWLEEMPKLSGLPIYVRVGSEDDLGFKEATEKIVERLRQAKISVNDGVLKGQKDVLNVDLVEMFNWMDEVKKTVMARDVERPLRSLVIPTSRPASKPTPKPGKTLSTQPNR